MKLSLRHLLNQPNECFDAFFQFYMEKCENIKDTIFMVMNDVGIFENVVEQVKERLDHMVQIGLLDAEYHPYHRQKNKYYPYHKSKYMPVITIHCTTESGYGLSDAIMGQFYTTVFNQFYYYELMRKDLSTIDGKLRYANLENFVLFIPVEYQSRMGVDAYVLTATLVGDYLRRQLDPYWDAKNLPFKAVRASLRVLTSGIAVSDTIRTLFDKFPSEFAMWKYCMVDTHPSNPDHDDERYKIRSFPARHELRKEDNYIPRIPPYWVCDVESMYEYTAYFFAEEKPLPYRATTTMQLYFCIATKILDNFTDQCVCMRAQLFDTLRKAYRFAEELASWRPDAIKYTSDIPFLMKCLVLDSITHVWESIVEEILLENRFDQSFPDYQKFRNTDIISSIGESTISNFTESELRYQGSYHDTENVWVIRYAIGDPTVIVSNLLLALRKAGREVRETLFVVEESDGCSIFKAVQNDYAMEQAAKEFGFSYDGFRLEARVSWMDVVNVIRDMETGNKHEPHFID